MNDLRVLISGDYWHHEFQQIVSGFPSAVTLTPIDRLEKTVDDSFDLIVIAQSRPDQVAASIVEKVQASQPVTPIVALLGSWCEGGMRSDVPWPGVRRIYWHQWEGCFDQFSTQLTRDGLTLWHQPRTASDADNALTRIDQPEESTADLLVAISAPDQTQFEYLRDVVESFGWKSCWAERATFDLGTVDSVSAVCVDANNFSENLNSRIDWLRSKLPDKPISLVLNFPRSQDVAAAADRGIHEIVSKPFQSTSLKHAIKSSIKGNRSATSLKRKTPVPQRVKTVFRPVK